MVTDCNGCDAEWGGNATAHCGGCHRTFSGQQTFDKHRTGSHAKRYCLDPEAVLNKDGERVLELNSRAYPCWGTIGEKPAFWNGETL